MSSFKAIVMGAAAAGALVTSAAAMPMNDLGAQGVTVQKAAMVCDDRGRCIETRRHAHRFYRDYDYGRGPRPYGYHDDGPGVGFSFGAGPHGHGR
jgi:hypothetical protein